MTIPSDDGGRGRPSRPLPPSPRRVAAALLTAALLAISLARADGLRVVLIGPSIDDPTVARVRQELTLLGLDVEIVTAARAHDLAAVARERSAAAAARVETSPPEIVLWVDEEHSAGLPQESRVSESVKEGADPGLLALRAVELLRGRLLPVPASAAPSATPAAPPGSPAPSAPPAAAAPSPSRAAPPRRVAAPRPLSRLGLHAGPALAVSPGGVPVMPALRIGAAWRVAGPIEIDALSMIPLSTGSVAAEQGQIDLTVLAFGAGAAARWVDPLPGLSLRAGAGAGVAGFLFQGRAVPPWVSASGDRWSALPFLEAGAAYRFTPAVAVRADVLAALALPPPVLVIAGRDVASFGTPVVLASLGVEVYP